MPLTDLYPPLPYISICDAKRSPVCPGKIGAVTFVPVKNIRFKNSLV
jgi:hypothetical protein